jgi:polyferredoxin
MEVEIKMGFKYQRLLGYFLGFILFYAPFALFQKIIFFAFTGKWQQLTIHSLCFRIQTEHLLDGKLLLMSLPFIACIVILLIVTLFFGPVFCGRLCPAGAYRVFKQSHTIKAADKLAYLYRDRSVSLWHAGRVCDIAIF